jgi:hypothetical protein
MEQRGLLVRRLERPRSFHITSFTLPQLHAESHHQGRGMLAHPAQSEQGVDGWRYIGVVLLRMIGCQKDAGVVLQPEQDVFDGTCAAYICMSNVVAPAAYR